AAHRPDVVVVDVRMPPTFTDEGLRAALVVRSTWPDVGVLVLSQYVEERYATELLSDRPQGVGYLLKDRVADLAEFLDALERVATGGSALDPEVVAQLLARSRQPGAGRPAPGARNPPLLDRPSPAQLATHTVHDRASRTLLGADRGVLVRLRGHRPRGGQVGDLQRVGQPDRQRPGGPGHAEH